MIAVDIGVVLLVLLGAAWGGMRGALRQVLDASVWILTFVVPGVFGGIVAHALEKPLHVSFSLAYVFCLLGLAALTQIVTRLSIRSFREWLTERRKLRALARGEEPGTPQRSLNEVADGILGGLIGAAKIAGIAWVTLSLIAVADEYLVRQGVRLRIEQSSFFKLAEANNAVGLIFGPAIQRLRVTLERRFHGVDWPKQGPLKELMKDERFVAVMKDPSIRTALATGDFKALERSPALLSLLTDDQLVGKLDAILDDKQTVPPDPGRVKYTGRGP